jgi:predicted nucleic acid-binding protein
MIADAEPFALTGVVVTEILQGLKRDVSRLERYLSQWEMLEPNRFSTYREAAGIFRAARAKGVAVTTIDVLIAAIALEHGATLFTLGLHANRRHHPSPSLRVFDPILLSGRLLRASLLGEPPRLR